ncbi:MAG: V-type ATPase subunit [Candidatus Marsarchaeota archaeon]|nr:V-type ATPase subunit [Candidatus Marsarchaeota archaeon]
MDLTYFGAYGRLRANRSSFLSPDYVDQLAQKDSSEFLKSLSDTPYRQQIDRLSSIYKMPELVEVVINAHMVDMIKKASFAMPPIAANFVKAYVSRWDIENIKLILSSKVLGYGVEYTDTFLTVSRGTPVGIFSGMIGSEDYSKIIEQRDIEGVVNSLVRYGYGAILMKFMDDARRSNNVSAMIVALDIYYFERLTESLKFYNGDEGPMAEYISQLIDIKNIMSVLKGGAGGSKQQADVKDYLIAGGRLPVARLTEMQSKDPEALKQLMPFKIDPAIDTFKTDGFLSHIETALKVELDKKYLKVFDSLPGSIESILGFIIRSEIERDELRSIWLSKHYAVSKERAESLRTLRKVLL